jgi:hypothetical protein
MEALQTPMAPLIAAVTGFGSPPTVDQDMLRPVVQHHLLGQPPFNSLGESPLFRSGRSQVPERQRSVTKLIGEW